MEDKRLFIRIPNELHKEIKVRAANRNITMRDYVIIALEEFKEKKELYEIEDKE